MRSMFLILIAIVSMVCSDSVRAELKILDNP